MTDETLEQPRRGRPPRSEETAQRRRRRGTEATLDAKLPIPPEIKAELDRKGLVPRWVNDEGNRMHRLTVQDDYDPVAGVDPVPVGLDKTGKPIMAHLLAKPRDFIEEDQRNAEDRRQEVERALLRSPDDVDAASRGANPQPASVRRYVDKNSSINRGNQILEG